MIPRRKASAARHSHIAGDMTDPKSEWFDGHTNTSVAPRPPKAKKAPMPRMQYPTTPMATGGTMMNASQKWPLIPR